MVVPLLVHDQVLPLPLEGVPGLQVLYEPPQAGGWAHGPLVRLQLVAPQFHVRSCSQVVLLLSLEGLPVTQVPVTDPQSGLRQVLAHWLAGGAGSHWYRHTKLPGKLRP